MAAIVFQGTSPHLIPLPEHHTATMTSCSCTRPDRCSPPPNARASTPSPTVSRRSAPSVSFRTANSSLRSTLRPSSPSTAPVYEEHKRSSPGFVDGAIEAFGRIVWSIEDVEATLRDWSDRSTG
jgi:hypothetical protein